MTICDHVHALVFVVIHELFLLWARQCNCTLIVQSFGSLKSQVSHMDKPFCFFFFFKGQA